MKKKQWLAFLRRVWGDSEGWAFLAYVAGGDFKQKVYSYPDQLEMLVREAEQLNGWASVYFCTHLCSSSKSRSKENALPVHIIWVDKDKGQPEELQPKPTICWQTSEGRYQAVWVLDKPAPPDRAEQANRNLAYRCGGDKGKWSLSTVFRLPGSTNHKYTPPQEGFLLWDDGPTYSIEDLLPPVSEKPVTLPEGEFPEIPQELPDASKVLREFGGRISQQAWDLMNKEPAPHEDWSERLWRLERLLFEAGLPLEAVFVAVRESAVNKYARDGRPDSHLWVEVVKASRETAPFEDPEPDSPSLPWMGLRRLMGFSERPSWLVRDIWMARNVGWLVGRGKSYKSILSIDLALSVASGEPFLGMYPVIEPGPVLIVQEEDPLWRVAHRVQLIAKQKGIASLEIGEDMSLTLEVPDLPIYASVGGGFLFENTNKVAALEADIERIRPKLVLIDPFFMVSAGIDEFKAGEVTPILNLLKHWRNKYRCAIGLVHHYRKGQGDLRERVYGSMAFYAWSENSLFFSRKGNIVVLERDIKDARHSANIAVEIQDIEEEYRYVLREDIAVPFDLTDPEHKIKAFLASCGPGRTLPLKDLMDASGVSRKMAGKILDSMEKEGLVELDRKGQGGRISVKILDTLMTDAEEEGLIL